MGRWLSLTAVIAAMTIALGCAKESPQDITVVDDARWLKDGEALSWKLEPGMYKLELTANNDGAAVEWVGAPCAGTAETDAYTGICEFASTGQVVVKNPTAFASGLSTSITVRITKLAHAATAAN